MMKTILEIQDELNIAKNFVAAVYLVCERTMSPDGDERGAACAVANAAREKLEAIDAALDEIRGGSNAPA